MRAYICITLAALLFVGSDALVDPTPDAAAVVPETDFEETLQDTANLPPCTTHFLKSVRHWQQHSCMETPKKGGLRPIHFTVTVPHHCTPSKKCGVIVNTHGMGMNGHNQEHITGVADAALKGEKFIVISPTDASASWELGKVGAIMGHESDDAALISHFVSKTINTFKDIVDKKHVHAMGFSMGGMMTIMLLCKYPKLFCSTSQAASVPTFELFIPDYGMYLPGLPTCFSPGGTGTQPKRSMMYQISADEKDPYFSGQASNAFKNSLASVKATYGVTGKGTKLSKGPGVDWTRYQIGGVTLEAATYDFTSSNTKIGGHCVPTKGDKKSMNEKCGNEKADGFVSGYTWSMEAIKFFKANPCLDKPKPKPPKPPKRGHIFCKRLAKHIEKAKKGIHAKYWFEDFCSSERTRKTCPKVCEA